MTDNKPMLKLDWCSHEAAKYAVEHWHYSKTLPAFGRRITIDAWEDNQFVGAIIYAYSASPNIAKHWKLQQTQIIELRRVAFKSHKSAISKCVSISIKMVKKFCPGLKLIISFADADQNHLGIIYQASNWIYTGFSMDAQKDGYTTNRGFIHCRTAGSMGRNTLQWVRENVDQNATDHISIGKHCYLMPLDDAMRKQIEPLRKPYPKRGTGETDNAAQSNAQTGGASPTVPLSKITEDK